MGCVSKYGLLTINFFVLAFGLCVIGVSAAILHQNTIYGVLLSNLFYSVPLIILLSGIFLTCLGVLGCLGAIKEHPVLLKLYAVVITVILIVTMTAGITMLVFTANTSSFLVRGMTNVFNEYGEEDKEYITHDLDIFQQTMHCCGIISYTDWANFTFGNNTNVADGCCRNQTVGCGEDLLQDPDVEDLVYTTGCLSFVVNAFDAICLTLGILTFALACFQALSIAWACIIAKDSRRYEHI
ncbi:CD63 antigen-like [Portunus trituberculatus]|uniref:CD63 antigen-like n=1 Tax=Portunus trituberculatus TaxID=210409 RepID=UPI001E1D0D0E|nr:CD63 antigen-like [Portunus trituberculatus]